jgi:hypothetical protein
LFALDHFDLGPQHHIFMVMRDAMSDEDVQYFLRPKGRAQQDAWAVGSVWWKKRCAYCGGSACMFEHVHPRSAGGANVSSNLVPSCYVCNRRKYDQPVEVFLANDPNTLLKILLYQQVMQCLPGISERLTALEVLSALIASEPEMLVENLLFPKNFETLDSTPAPSSGKAEGARMAKVSKSYDANNIVRRGAGGREGNPKTPGKLCYARFEGYRFGWPLWESMEPHGPIRSEDVRWDLKRQFIILEKPKP